MAAMCSIDFAPFTGIPPAEKLLRQTNKIPERGMIALFRV
jgi:hypothetical protein